MAYYGFRHRYGSNQRDEDGDLIGTLMIFDSRRARDAWLDGGNPLADDRGARTVVKSRYAAKFRHISAAVEFARDDAADAAR